MDVGFGTEDAGAVGGPGLGHEVELLVRFENGRQPDRLAQVFGVRLVRIGGDGQRDLFQVFVEDLVQLFEQEQIDAEQQQQRAEAQCAQYPQLQMAVQRAHLRPPQPGSRRRAR